jgi:hypothetical protein
VAEGSPLDITINNLNVTGESSANSTLATEHMPRIQGKIVAKVGNASVQWSPYASQDEVGSSHSITFPFVYLAHTFKGSLCFLRFAALYLLYAMAIFSLSLPPVSSDIHGRLTFRRRSGAGRP